MISGNRVPDIGGDTSTFGNDIRLLVSNFMTYTFPVGHDKAGEELLGAAAAKAYYEHIQELVTANSPEVCMKVLTPLQVFGWLISEEQRAKVLAWSNKEFQKGAMPADALVAAKTKTGRKRLATDAAAEVAKMFRN